MKKFLKWGAIGFVALIVIGAIASAGKSPSTSTTAPSESSKSNSQAETTEPTSSAPKEWTTVTEVSGNSNKRTDTFSLTGGKARLTYTFEGGTAIIGSIYVMKEGESLDEQGGFPEVTVTEAGTDSTFLTKGAGSYYLDIKSANADWTVKVEEEK